MNTDIKYKHAFAFILALLNKAMAVEMCDATKMSNAQKAKYIK